MKLKQGCSIYSDYGLNISAEEYADDGVPIIRTSDVDNSGALDLSHTKYVEPSVVGTKRLRKGDVLFSRSGTIGRAMVFDADVEATYAAYLVRFRPHPKRLLSKFVGYWAQSADYWHQIGSDTIQSTIGNFNANKFANLSIPDPDLATQRQIADFLDRETARIDLLIEKKQKLVALLGEKRKSYISQIINRNKDAQKLKNVVQVLNGYAFKSDLFQDDGIPVVRQSNLKNGKILHDGRCYPAALTPRNFLLKKDDLCIGLSGSIENFGLITTEELPAALNQRVGVLRSKQNRCHTDYLIFYVQSEMFKDHIQKNLPSTTIVNIDAQLIRNAPFPTIKYEEQVLESRKMLEVTSAIEKVCDGTITSIDCLKEYRSALITAAVTGQIDVATYSKSGATDRRLDAVQEEMGA